VLFCSSSSSSFSRVGQVFIAQKDFVLTTADGAVAFLAEMHNLVEMFEELAGTLDRDKAQELGQVNKAAAKVISLTAKAKQKKTAGTDFMGSIGEVDADDEAQDDLGVFGADDIQAILKRMNYKINFIVFGVCVLRASENVILMNQIHPAVSAHRLSFACYSRVREGIPEVREGRSEGN
jgi:hypothetical protein